MLKDISLISLYIVGLLFGYIYINTFNDFGLISIFNSNIGFSRFNIFNIDLWFSFLELFVNIYFYLYII